MLEFAKTSMGRKLFEGTLPRIADSLESIAKHLAAQQIPSSKGQLERMQVETTNADHPIADSKFQEDPTKCPYCGSTSCSAQNTDFQADTVFNEVHCQDCGRAWSEQYILMGYQSHPSKEALITNKYLPQVRAQYGENIGPEEAYRLAEKLYKEDR